MSMLICIAITSSRYLRLALKVRTLFFSPIATILIVLLAHLNTSYRHFFLFINEVCKFLILFLNY